MLPNQTFGSGSLVKHVLNEDTLVASTVADGYAEVYTDFAVHGDGASRMVLLVGGMAPGAWAAWCKPEIETYRMARCLGLPQRGRLCRAGQRRAQSWPNWRSHPQRHPRKASPNC